MENSSLQKKLIAMSYGMNQPALLSQSIHSEIQKMKPMKNQNNPHLHISPSALKLELMATSYGMLHKNPNHGIKDSIASAKFDVIRDADQLLNDQEKYAKYKLKQLK